MTTETTKCHICGIPENGAGGQFCSADHSGPNFVPQTTKPSGKKFLDFLMEDKEVLQAYVDDQLDIIVDMSKENARLKKKIKKLRVKE